MPAHFLVVKDDIMQNVIIFINLSENNPILYNCVETPPPTPHGENVRMITENVDHWHLLQFSP